MLKEESELIGNLRTVTNDLYYKFFRQKVVECGMPGTCGPSSNPDEIWTPEMGKLQSIYFMLNDIKEVICKKKL